MPAVPCQSPTGSKSIHDSNTVFTDASSAAAQLVPSCPGCGVTVSQIVRSTSIRFHVDCRDANTSTTSDTDTGDASNGCCRAASAIDAVNVAASMPKLAASRCHRVRRSGTPSPVFFDGCRPRLRVPSPRTRTPTDHDPHDRRKSASLSPISTSISRARFEN